MTSKTYMYNLCTQGNIYFSKKKTTQKQQLLTMQILLLIIQYKQLKI